MIIYANTELALNRFELMNPNSALGTGSTDER